MPYPYVIGEEKIEDLSKAERKAIKNTDKLMSEMEASLSAKGDSQQLRDFKQFRKHFHNVTNERLYDGRIEPTTAKEQYAQSVAWIEDFMNNSVKAASLKNFFDSYKGGIGASDFDASLFVLEIALGVDYDSDAIDEMQPKVLKNPKLLEQSGTIEERTFSEDETFGQDREVEKLLESRRQIDAEIKKMAEKNDLFTRPKNTQSEVKGPDYSNESDTYSYGHGREKFDQLSNNVKHSFFELREKMYGIEAQLEKKGKTEELSALKVFHTCLHDITDNSLYHGAVYSAESAQKKYADSQNGLKEIMGDPKKLSAIISTIGEYSNDKEMDNLESCLIYLSDTFGINYDFDKAKEMIDKKGTGIGDTVAEEAQPESAKNIKINEPAKNVAANIAEVKEPTKKNVAANNAEVKEPAKKSVAANNAEVKEPAKKNVAANNTEVKEPVKKDVAANNVEVKEPAKKNVEANNVKVTEPAKKNVEVKVSGKTKAKANGPVQPADSDELVRAVPVSVPVESTLKQLAPDLKARHTVSFIGGGQSTEMQKVQSAVDEFMLFCENPDAPQFAGINEADLLEKLKGASQNYIAEKKKGRWRNTDDPNWRPNTEMGRKRYEAVLCILDVVNERLDQLDHQKHMAAHFASKQAPVAAAAEQVKDVPGGAANAPAEKVEEKPTVENMLGSEQIIMKKKGSAVTIVKEEEVPDLEIDESQLDNNPSKEKVNMDALYNGKQNVFDMAKQDVRIGSIVRYQNNIRTILNQGKPAPENFNKMKNDLGKEYAGIIATKSIWKKPSDMIGDVYKKEGPESYKEQKKAFETDKKKRNTIQNQLVNKDKGFDRMMAGVKDWNGAVDMSMKALSPNASEMLRDYVVNKNIVANNQKKQTVPKTVNPKKEL